MTTTAKPTTRRVTRPRRAAPAAAFQAPLMPDPAERRTHHNGVAIVREELISNLPGNKSPFRYTRLILVDGTTAIGCRDCPVSTDNRGGMFAHRNEKHGTRNGKKPRKIGGLRPLAANASIDLVLAPREDGSTPSDFRSMTMGEVEALMPTIAALGDLIDRTEAENQQLREALSKLQVSKEDQHKIDVYETNREEIVSLRLQVQKWGNYEEVKAEMYALRAWKRKITAKLSAAASILDEEGQ